MRRALLWAFPCVVAAAIAGGARADQTITLDGTVMQGGLDHVAVPFTVPAGIHEIQIDHTYVVTTNDTLDFGLTGPDGFRGWGGGNKESAIVGDLAASRSYLTGPITPGTWNVNIGKANLGDPMVTYHVVVTLRTASTLAPQTERHPYVASAPLSNETRWYAGDLHAHSRESGDAAPTIDDLVTFARGRGLDFVELSEHNTVSQLDFIDTVQAAHQDILIVPGVEFTTYAGHANGIGATVWVDHKIGQPGVTIAGAAQAFRDQGALFSINHPLYNIGALCIGCSWNHDLDPTAVDAVEVATSGTSAIFGTDTLAFWDKMLNTGRHLPAVSGSDDHNAGQKIGAFSTAIGQPTLYVYAKDLSVASLLDGIRNGRTVVKINGVTDPMVEISSSVPAAGDTISAEATTLHAKITGGSGLTARWVVNGTPDNDTDIKADPFDLVRPVSAPKTGEDRYRVEVVRSGMPTTVTSHVWVQFKAGVGVSTADVSGGSCACSLPPGAVPADGGAITGRGDASTPWPWAIALGGLALAAGVARRGASRATRKA